ncbi:thioredoxin O2, mitochondrial-like isoform X2 [Malus sylvestris]|uniref:thioredoxin O2, mitochondrial-like isoform X2 n=1 Tax=Malus sylvestris TaxID=3752 RepID=UPI0021AD0592|nr:thioredoxin O2, mitochondrial-like isoform X2 [Malus sylvestris]
MRERKMARNSGVAMARQLLGNHSKFCTALLHHYSLPSSSFQTLASSIPTSPPPPPTATPFTSNSLHHSPNPRFLQLQPLSSPSGSSNIVVIKSEDEYNSTISKAKDGAEPALFYFTAVWCGPCKFISPVIGELSEQYPHATTYKIDIDEEGLTNTLGKLNISAVPTFHLFQDGKKVAEVVGADVARLRDTFGKLYK